MGALTTYGRQLLLSHTFIAQGVLGNTAVALTVVIPGTTDDVSRLVEPDYRGGYERMYYEWNGGWQVGQPGEVFNRNTITFLTPTADWGTIRGWALLNDRQEHVIAAGQLRRATMIKAGMSVVITPLGLRVVLR